MNEDIWRQYSEFRNKLNEAHCSVLFFHHNSFSPPFSLSNYHGLRLPLHLFHQTPFLFPLYVSKCRWGPVQGTMQGKYTTFMSLPGSSLKLADKCALWIFTLFKILTTVFPVLKATPLASLKNYTFAWSWVAKCSIQFFKKQPLCALTNHLRWDRQRGCYLLPYKVHFDKCDD